MTSQVSRPYKSTDFTQALNILIVVSFRNDNNKIIIIIIIIITIIINVHWFSRQRCPLFSSDINKNSNFLGRFSKTPQISNFIAIRPVGAELFCADGRTDVMNLTVASRDFENSPKISTDPTLRLV